MGVLLRSFLVVLGWALVQGQIVFSILIKLPDPISFLATFIIALQASLLLEEFEQAFLGWLSSLLLTMVFIFIFLSLPAFLGVLPIEMVFIIINANLSRVLVSVVMLLAPLGFLGCFFGQILRDMLVEDYT